MANPVLDFLIESFPNISADNLALAMVKWNNDPFETLNWLKETYPEPDQVIQQRPEDVKTPESNAPVEKGKKRNRKPRVPRNAQQVRPGLSGGIP